MAKQLANKLSKMSLLSIPEGQFQGWGWSWIGFGQQHMGVRSASRLEETGEVAGVDIKPKHQTCLRATVCYD